MRFNCWWRRKVNAVWWSLVYRIGLEKNSFLNTFVGFLHSLPRKVFESGTCGNGAIKYSSKYISDRPNGRSAIPARKHNICLHSCQLQQLSYLIGAYCREYIGTRFKRDNFFRYNLLSISNFTLSLSRHMIHELYAKNKNNLLVLWQT